MKASLSLLVVILSSITCFPQKFDTAFVRESIAHTQKLYNDKMKAEWPLNAGGQYADYAPIEEEHPYFLSDDWMEGSVVYMNDVYHKIPLLFDLRTEKLITEHTPSAMQIELTSDKVRTFTMDGHLFIRFYKDSVKNLPETGFYNVLQTGNVSLLARRKKNIQQSISSGKIVAITHEINRYYVLKLNEVIPVRSKKSIISALNDLPDLKKMVRRSNLAFGKNRETGLSETVRIYNEMRNQK